jgi:hypothetical protein
LYETIKSVRPAKKALQTPENETETVSNPASHAVSRVSPVSRAATAKAALDAKPWIAAGMSRATWFRRQAAAKASP